METTTTRPAKAARWHAEVPEATLDRLESGRQGLTPEEARARLDRFGPNALPRDGRSRIPELLWRQVNDPLLYVLLASAGLALLLGKGVDGLVVLGVVVLNVLIGFIQEFRAGQAIEALTDLVPENVVVVRGGARLTVPAADLVPGDIVMLQAGDRVPADLRVLDARGLTVDEAALTGESVPVEKTPDPVEEDAALADRRGMLYNGTLVAAGTGQAVVAETGPRTELGRISSMLKEAREVETPLTRQLGRFGASLTVAITVVAVLLFGIALWRDYPLVDAVLAAITLAVAAIPEGLPAIITIALAIGVQRMARRHAIIRKLPAVETLGSTTIICSDKTGTLTRGEMTVQALWTPGSGRFELSGTGYAPEGELAWRGETMRGLPGEVEALLQAAVLCNDAALRRGEGTDGAAGAWHIVGDPTEGALVVAAEKVRIHVGKLRHQWHRVDVVPFESARQYMATLHRFDSDQVDPSSGGAHQVDGQAERVAIVKGAPEVIVGRCTLQTQHERYGRFVLEQAESLAAAGMRVLAVASKRVGPEDEVLDEDDLAGGFNLLGLVAMIDPPRPEVIEAVAACRRAGIQVKMITGDHALTARAIGRQLGLLREQDPVVTGSRLETLGEEELRETARHVHVFARVAPEHKLRLVRALQAHGHVVAMTGDGVNDAPALKQADIGVAMGITGTAASREAADMVLTDDNFTSIAAAVEEGRRVYDNLIKSLAFVLPTNMGEALIVLLAVLFFPIVGGTILMPMLPVQILWINLVATVALALPLAFEAMEPGLMHRPPRVPGEPLLNRFVLARTVVVALLMTAGGIGLFLYEYDVQLAAGVTGALAVARSQTVAVTTVILFQIFYLLQCRSLRDSILKIGLWTNHWVYVGIGVLLVLQLGFVYLPFMNSIFGSAPLDGDAWFKALLAALVVLPVITIEKWWRGRRHQTQVHRHLRDADAFTHDRHPEERPVLHEP